MPVLRDQGNSLRDIYAQSNEAARHANLSVERIRRITAQMKMLAINAKIEAARAGDAGRGFSIVADEVGAVGTQINDIAADMQEKLSMRLSGLNESVLSMERLSTSERLIDLAFTAVDTIDRSLYERTCDVRWWATDAAFVAALTKPDAASLAMATKRLGVILDAYNIYLDLWLIDRQGQIVANARPGKFPLAGRSVTNRPWFAKTLAHSNGDQFEAGDVVQSDYLAQSKTITYNCAVRENGDKNGRVLGLLTTCFDWEPQARGILTSLRMDASMRARNSRALLIDRQGIVIAAGDDRPVNIALSDGTPVNSEKVVIPAGCDPKSGAFEEDGKLICYHTTQGFETYKGLGWRGVVTQDIPHNGEDRARSGRKT